MTPKTSFNLQSKFSLTDCDRTCERANACSCTVAITSQPGLQFCPLPFRVACTRVCHGPHTAAYIDLQNRHGRPRDVTEVANGSVIRKFLPYSLYSFNAERLNYFYSKFNEWAHW